MNILIVGGTGLISTAITRLALESGHRITHFNRGATAARLPAGHQPPRVIRGDRNDAPAFERAVQSAGRFDAVIDMICYTPAQAQSAVRAFRGQTGHYVFCSSVDAYQKPYRRYPVTEDAPLGGLTVYGQDKARCEGLLLQQHGTELPVTVLRPAHTIGPGGQLLDLFGWNSHVLSRIAAGLPIISHGDGSSLWGACHVDDVAGAFLACLGRERALGRAYHLAADEVQTWDQYYQGCAQALGVPCPELVHIPTDLLYAALPEQLRECAQNFQFDNIFDNAAARADLGFRQTIGFVDTVREIYAWLRENGRLQPADGNPFYDEIIAAFRPLARDFVAALASRRAS